VRGSTQLTVCVTEDGVELPDWAQGVDTERASAARIYDYLLGGSHNFAADRDFRRPAEILADPAVRDVLAFDEPVAVLLVAVLHAVPDADDPHRTVAELRDALAPGSHLVVAHGTADSRPDASDGLVRVSQRTTTPLTLRPRDEVLRFFDGWELAEPGLVWAPAWRPDDDPLPGDPAASGNLAGVARKP
jgi:S-adenosyl methyltransferase